MTGYDYVWAQLVVANFVSIDRESFDLSRQITDGIITKVMDELQLPLRDSTAVRKIFIENGTADFRRHVVRKIQEMPANSRCGCIDKLRESCNKIALSYCADGSADPEPIRIWRIDRCLAPFYKNIGLEAVTI